MIITSSFLRNFKLNQKRKLVRTKAPYYACLIIVLMGALLGSLVVGYGGNAIVTIIENQLTVILETGLNVSFLTFITWFFPELILLFFCLAVSFSPFGTFILSPILMLKGFGIGLFCGNLCVIYGLRGLLYSSIIFMPAFILKAFALINLCKNGIYFSNKQFETIFFGCEHSQDKSEYSASLVASFVCNSVVACLGVLLQTFLVSIFRTFIV